jgi:CheY-like chemotaxis protein
MEKHFLLADDDDDDLIFFKDAVLYSKLPIKVSTVDDCDGVLLQVSSQTQPDLIILDNSLPRKSSLDCLTAIRKQFSLAQLPVVILSTSVPAIMRIKAYVAGFNLVLEKPQSFVETIDLFKRLFNVDWRTTPVITQEEFYSLTFTSNQ